MLIFGASERARERFIVPKGLSGDVSVSDERLPAVQLAGLDLRDGEPVSQGAAPAITVACCLSRRCFNVWGLILDTHPIRPMFFFLASDPEVCLAAGTPKRKGSQFSQPRFSRGVYQSARVQISKMKKTAAMGRK